MSIKASKTKTAPLNGNPSTNGKSANGDSSKTAKAKKSIYEKWIEKYGVSDSKADRSMLKTMKKIYEANNKSAA